MFVVYFLIKVEINLLNNVNLTDCFTSTLKEYASVYTIHSGEVRYIHQKH